MIIIDNELEHDERIIAAAAVLKSKEDVRIMSKHSMEALLDADTCTRTDTIFVLSEFDGNLFHRLEQSQGKNL